MKRLKIILIGTLIFVLNLMWQYQNAKTAQKGLNPFKQHKMEMACISEDVCE